MESTTPIDKSEPNHFKITNLLLVLIYVSAVALFSCNKKKKDTSKEFPSIDNVTTENKKVNAKDSAINNYRPKKKIYITFDDAPNLGTMNVLNAVKEDSIPASFFVVGKHIYQTPEQTATWERLKADSLIELCNHSYSHALNHYKNYYLHPSLVVKDVEMNKEKIGFNTNVVRMPGRNAWRIDSFNRTDIIGSKAAIDSVHAAGFAVVGWDVEWFYNQKNLSLAINTDLLLRQIQNKLESNKTRTPGHLILLAHDQEFISEKSIEQLHYLFHQLKNNPEYELSLIKDYPGIKKDLPK